MQHSILFRDGGSEHGLANFILKLTFMEPLSIATTVGATCKFVYEVSTTLYAFINSAKVVDKSFEALHAEVQGLHRVLDLVEKTINEPALIQKDIATSLGNGIWTSIDHAVQDCQRTATALEQILRRLGNGDKASNLFKKAAKQIQLNISTDDINNIRSRIHTHSFNLHLALQMATL